MEEAFKEFIKDKWPGFLQKEAFFDFTDACLYENIKQAFEAGWEAKEEKK